MIHASLAKQKALGRTFSEESGGYFFFLTVRTAAITAIAAAAHAAAQTASNERFEEESDGAGRSVDTVADSEGSLVCSIDGV